MFGTIDAKGIVTEEMCIDINQMPSSDPLAFAYGLNTGQRYAKKLLELINEQTS